MFTGIVDHCGTILEIQPKKAGIKALIQTNFNDLEEGESIAVNGICLTAQNITSQQFWCDISPETLQVSTAATFSKEQKVNLERALRLGDRLGGHWVTGHVDQRGLIKTITPAVPSELQEGSPRRSSLGCEGGFIQIHIINISENAFSFLVPKGSIAVNGVSLTINEVTKNGFNVMLVPHTLARTNLADLKMNDDINIEFDWMVKIIKSQVENSLKNEQEKHP